MNNICLFECYDILFVMLKLTLNKKKPIEIGKIDVHCFLYNLTLSWLIFSLVCSVVGSFG